MLKNIKVKAEVLTKPLDKISFGYVDTKFGPIALAHSTKAGVPLICYLHFSKGWGIAHFASLIRKQWPDVNCTEDSDEAEKVFAQISKEQKRATVLLTGSEFQNQVWMTLIQIPFGEVRTYNEVAEMINSPGSTMAVASAVAKNNIALLVPCHRVKAKNNDQNKYRWGSDLKEKLLLDEQQ